MAKLKKAVAPFRSLEVAQETAQQSAEVPAEVVAAIAGAIAVVCGDGAVVTDIRRAVRREAGTGRGTWAMAGLLENTRPF